MRKLFSMVITAVCILAFAGEAPANQPTTGNGPAFATSADVKLSTVRELISARDYSKAEQLALEVTLDAPEVTDGWMMLGYTRALNGHYFESNEAYDQALERGAAPREVLTRKAYNCRRLGDLVQSRACYNRLLEVVGDDIEILMQYGAFESGAAGWDEAVAAYTRVLDIAPDNVEAVRALAAVEEKRGNASQVAYWIDYGLSQHPNDVKLLRKRAGISLSSQDFTHAVEFLNRLVAADPESQTAWRNLGIAHYQLGHKRDAVDAFAKVHELGGELNGLYGPIADCYRTAGRAKDALDVIEKGLAAGSQLAWLYSVRGKIYEDRGAYDQAIASFRKAVNLKDDPWSSYARKQIGRQVQLKKRAKMMAAQGGSH